MCVDEQSREHAEGESDQHESPVGVEHPADVD